MPLPSTSSLIYSDDSIMHDDFDSYHMPASLPPLPQPVIKANPTRRSQSSDSLALPPTMPSVMEEDSSSLSPNDDFRPPPLAPRPPRPSMSQTSKPPTAPSRPSLSSSTAGRVRPSHQRSSSTSTSAPTLLPIKLTPNELEANLHSLATTLHDTTSHEWDSRIAALSQLQSIALGCQLTHTLPSFIQHFRQLRQPLCQQIGDLRSSVVRSTCSTLSTIAQLCGQPFSDECDALIPALLKLVAVSVAVIAQSGDEAIRAMLRFCSPNRGLTAIIDSAKGSTSAPTRAKCMEYVVMWMEERRRMSEDAAIAGGSDEGRWEAAMDVLIREKLADKTESVRVGARKAAVLYCRLWEESGRRLLDGVDEKVRRLIEEGRKKDGADDSCLPTSAAIDKTRETEKTATRKAVSTQRRSLSMKAAEETKATVLPDKENNHPNTTSEQSSVVQPSILHKPALRRQSGQFVQQPISTQPAAPASTAEDRSPPVPAVRSARRQSFSLISLVGADRDGAKRLSGARRVSVAPLPAQHDTATISTAVLPPRPPRQSLSVTSRSLTGQLPAAAATNVVNPLHAPTTVTAELVTALHSLSTTSQAGMVAAVQAAVQDAAAPAADDRMPSVANGRQGRSLLVSANVEKQQELREMPTEKTHTASTVATTKRSSLGAATTHVSSTASLIPRRSSFSLPSENKPQMARPASVMSLLAGACEASLSVRVAALESLTAYLSTLTSASRAGTADVESHLDRLVSVLAEKVLDSHPRVVTTALSALTALLTSCASIPSLPPLLCPHLVLLLSSLFRILPRSQQPVKQQCDGLLTALCSVYPGVDLLPPLISLLSASSTLSSAERSHTREFAAYVCEWGDEEMKRTKRGLMDGVEEEEKQSSPPRQQRKSSEQRSADESIQEESDGGEADGGSVEEQAEVDVDDATGQNESKYDSPEDDHAIPLLAELPPALALPSPLSVSPPHSLALSPGLARRLAPVLSTPSPVAAESHSTLDLFPASTPAPIVTLPVPTIHTPLSSPTRAQPIATPAALSFPIHSVFPAAPTAAVTRPASVATAATRSSVSTSHQRSLSASSAPSAPAARHKQAARTTLKAKKRISLTTAPSSTTSTAATASLPTAPPARRSPTRPLPVSLSDTDVSALIYQWKHADLPVVTHSLNFATQQLANPDTTQLCNPAIDRLIAAAILLPAAHPTTTAAVVALLSVILSPVLCGEGGKDATRLAVHLQTAAFPHAAGLVELVVAAHARAVGAVEGGKGEREAVEQLWSAIQRYCHRATLVTAITTQLSTASPTSHTSLTLLLTSLSTLLPHLSPKAVEAVMPSLSHALCLLLSHEQVVVRKQCVSVWVSCWRVLGGGVERWMSGLTPVTRRLVDIYLAKAKDEQAIEKTGGGK